MTVRRLVRTNDVGIEKRHWTVVGPPRQPGLVENGASDPRRATPDRLERLFAAQAGGVLEGVQLHLVTVRGPQDVRLTDQVVWHTGTTQPPPEAYDDLLPGDRVIEVTAVRAAGRQDQWVLIAGEERER